MLLDFDLGIRVKGVGWSRPLFLARVGLGVNFAPLILLLRSGRAKWPLSELWLESEECSEESSESHLSGVGASEAEDREEAESLDEVEARR